MKTLRQFIAESSEYRENPIPVGQYNTEDDVNTTHLVKDIENNISKVREQTVVPHQMVKNNTLKATQSTLYSHGGGDPVFDGLKLPVLYKHSDGNHYILDGHHRMARALERLAPIEVHVFQGQY